MTAVAEINLEQTLISFEEDILPALEDAVRDCEPYVEEWRLADVQRALEVLEGFRDYLEGRGGV